MFLLIALVQLASAQIQVEIIPGSNARSPEVIVSGTERAKTADIDLKTFQLSETGVQENLARMELYWAKVGEVNINHASAYGYKDLFITLKPKSGRIVRSNDRVVKYKVGHKSVEVTETMLAKWHDIRDISLGNIKHIVGFNRVEHSSKYGQEAFATRAVTLEAEPNDVTTQGTGEHVKELQAKETTLEVRIDYEVSLDGDIHFGYLCTKLFVHHCLKHDKLDINDYFRRIGQSPILTPYEIVTFTYYHDSQVI